MESHTLSLSLRLAHQNARMAIDAENSVGTRMAYAEDAIKIMRDVLRDVRGKTCGVFRFRRIPESLGSRLAMIGIASHMIAADCDGGLVGSPDDRFAWGDLSSSATKAAQ